MWFTKKFSNSFKPANYEKFNSTLTFLNRNLSIILKYDLFNDTNFNKDIALIMSPEIVVCIKKC